MLAKFSGESGLRAAYDSVLYDTDVDLAVVEGALGEKAVSRMFEIMCIDDIHERTAYFQDLLYSEIDDLEEAENTIAAWAEDAGLPPEITVNPSLELANHRSVSSTAHFDDATALYKLMYGPFAMSIGISGIRHFQALRLPRRLSDDELTSQIKSPLTRFTHDNVRKGKILEPGAVYDQKSGDIVLIPGSPRPSLHDITISKEGSAMAVTNSYTMQLLQPWRNYDAMREYFVENKTAESSKES